MKRALITVIICIIIFSIEGPLFAQPQPRQPVLPPGTTAADEEKARLKKKPFEEFERKPEEAEIEEEEEEEAPPPAEVEKKFFVRKINVVGVTVPLQKEIEKIVKDYENKDLSLNDLMELADKISALYASKGYITSQAYVPPQRIVDETITIEVIEGEYGEFDIEGTRYTRKSIVQRRLKKKPGEIFDYNDLRSDILYLNENTDRIVGVTLVRGSRPRTTDFKVKVKDRPPIHAGYEISNTGSKSSGLWRHTYKLEDTNLFRYDDIFVARYIHSENINVYGIALDYLLPVNEFGTKLGASYSHFRSRAGHDYEDLDIKSRSTTYSCYLQHPIFDFNWLNGKLDAGLEVKEARTESRTNWLQPVQRDSRDRLRITKMGLTLDETDQWGRTIFRNELRWAPRDFLGSYTNIILDQDPSRQNADQTFFTYVYRLSRLNRLPFSAVLLFNLEGQATNNLLISSEQHRIGGMYSVRGYAEGEALGDYGANATAEVRTPFYFIPQDFHIYGINPRNVIQPVGFVDWGFVHAKSEPNTRRHNEKMIGIGGGLRINFENCITGRLDVAWPVGSKSTYGGGPRMHLVFNVDEPTLQQYEAMLEEMMQNRIRRSLNMIAKEVPQEMVESFEAALALEKEGRYEEAKELYVALINRKNEILESAKTDISDTIDKETDAAAYWEEAENYFKEDDYLKARESYEKILLLKKE